MLKKRWPRAGCAGLSHIGSYSSRSRAALLGLESGDNADGLRLVATIMVNHCDLIKWSKARNANVYVEAS